MYWFLARTEAKSIQTGTVHVDASGMIAGRLCSDVAKLLIEGNRVVVFNSEKTLLSGSRSNIMADWFSRLKIASVVHPKHGPFHPRTPDGMLTRMIRGMIPRRKPSGLAALRRLRVYVGVPTEFSNVKPRNFEDAKATKPIAYYVPLGEVAQRIGWKGAS